MACYVKPLYMLKLGYFRCTNGLCDEKIYYHDSRTDWFNGDNR